MRSDSENERNQAGKDGKFLLIGVGGLSTPVVGARDVLTKPEVRTSGLSSSRKADGVVPPERFAEGMLTCQQKL